MRTGTHSRTRISYGSTLTNNKMDAGKILKWLVTAIVILIAVVLLGLVLQIAGFLLKFAIKALLVLLAVAVVIRLAEVLTGRR